MFDRWSRAACLAALAAAVGCAGQPIVLRDAARGDAWVWPQSLEGQPAVLAFWTTDEMQCLRDIPALKALDSKEGSVQLITVATGRDRAEIDRWLRDERIGYIVLLDLEEKLAGRLAVETYPTYIFLDVRAREVSREGDIRLVRNWFDRERWRRRAEEPEASESPGTPAAP